MSEPQSCQRCGRSGDPGAGALAGMHDRLPGGAMRWTCASCVRDQLRAIEGRLPEEWPGGERLTA